MSEFSHRSLIDYTSTPSIRWHDEAFDSKKIEVFIKEDYKNHPNIQGNKVWKLLGALQAFVDSDKKSLLSFGGAYSNHLMALSAWAEESEVNFHALIRGHKPESLSYTLRALEYNRYTHTHYLSRTEYKTLSQERLLTKLEQDFPDSFIIWEGGTMERGLSGFSIFMDELIDQHPDVEQIWVPSGTGGTAAGILAYSSESISVHAVAVLKHQGLRDDILKWSHYEYNQIAPERLVLYDNYHFGGYAKHTSELLIFMEKLYERTGIVTDPIYNGKSFYALYQCALKNVIPKGSKIVIVHTGGLQGLLGFQERTGLLKNLCTAP